MMSAFPLFILLGLLVYSPGGTNSYGQRPEQGQADASKNEQAPFKPETLSPYLIELYIDINENVDLKQIWRLLKIETPTDMTYRCDGNCDAETFDIDTKDNERGKVVALKISLGSGGFYQYLIFRMVQTDSAKEEWRFIGNINSSDQQYGPPAHRIESADDRSWFVIRELWGRGSGAVGYGDVWYEIRQGEVKQVLSYPVEGHDTPCQKHLGRTFKSILLRYGQENGAYTVPVQFLVSYDISGCSRADESRPLFTRSQKAYYVWNVEKDKFALDKSRSDITEGEINTVFQVEGLTYKKFVEYNFNELLEITKRGDAEQKDWLRTVLTNLPDGKHKAELQMMLQQ
jgi:hypothetical protein